MTSENPCEAPMGDSGGRSGNSTRRRLSPTSLLSAIAWFGGAYAAIVFIASPAAKGAFDGFAMGYYAILIGVIASCLCAGMGASIAFRSRLVGVLFGLTAFVVLEMLPEWWLD